LYLPSADSVACEAEGSPGPEPLPRVWVMRFNATPEPSSTKDAVELAPWLPEAGFVQATQLHWDDCTSSANPKRMQTRQ
jgi:hypothetical protein